MFDENDDQGIDPTKLPIYKKGEEIIKVVKTIVDLIPEDNEMLQEVKGFMLADAFNLTIKVAGAEECIMVEIKAVINLEDVHLAQAINYVEAYNLEIGLLINFGAKSLQHKRVHNNKLSKSSIWKNQE